MNIRKDVNKRPEKRKIEKRLREIERFSIFVENFCCVLCVWFDHRRHR